MRGQRYYIRNKSTSIFLLLLLLLLLVSKSIGFVISITKRRSNMSSLLLSSCNDGSLRHLLEVSKGACDTMAPLIREIYNSMEDGSMKTMKEDQSAFTIADGIVQYLLVEYVFPYHLFGGLVGEEDVTDIQLPYRVQNLEIPSSFHSLIQQTITTMKKKQQEEYKYDYSNVIVFIDPIDGTREFSTGKGEQCSICIGFVHQQTHLPIAGLVYRPLSYIFNNNKKVWKATWAAGAKQEMYFESHLLPTTEKDDSKYLFTSNGTISPFLQHVMKHMNYKRYPSGGAGNKMLKLLEIPSMGMYLLDRGVSKWDTCAAQAILEAQGGLLIQLDPFFQSNEQSYTYKVTTQCLDIPTHFPAYLTRYNAQCYDETNNKNKKVPITNANMVKEYANICGMLALTKQGNTDEHKQQIIQAIQHVSNQYPPAFD